MKLDRCLYSRVLATVRGTDIAHPGEEENIDFMLSFFPKDFNMSILDFGCGLGGTISYIYNKGFHKTVGYDIDANSIEFAKKKYCLHNFYSTMDDLFNSKYIFDLIYAFNVFYLIEKKNKILFDFNNISRPGSLLYISDFTYKKNTIMNKLVKYIPFALPHYINLNLTNNIGNWEINGIMDISDLYIKWYTKFVEKIEETKEDVLKISNYNYYEYILNKYKYLLKNLLQENIGGQMYIIKRL